MVLLSAKRFDFSESADISPLRTRKNGARTPFILSGEAIIAW